MNNVVILKFNKVDEINVLVVNTIMNSDECVDFSIDPKLAVQIAWGMITGFALPSTAEDNLNDIKQIIDGHYNKKYISGSEAYHADLKKYHNNPKVQNKFYLNQKL